MNCQTVRTFLQIYLDGEFDADERRDLEEHLAQCPECRQRADYERRFREAMRARIPVPAAPRAFRAHMESMMEKTPARPGVLSRRLMLGSVPAVAALALIISFTWTVTSGFSPLVDEAVARHSAKAPVEVNSQKPGEVESWFRSKVDFNVSLPKFAKGRLRLEGARLSNLAQRQAAFVRYRLRGQRVSLFVVAGSGVDASGERCQRIHRREVCLSDVRGYTVISWRSRGLLYSMVGEASGEDLLKILRSSP